MVDEVGNVVVSIGRGASPTPLPLHLSDRMMVAAAEMAAQEAKLKYELITLWHDCPALTWRQFLTMKLGEAKRASDFATMRHLRTFLAT